METINLLDLDNDILNIIGNYVKKDNIDVTVKNSIKLYKIIKKSKWNNDKPAMRHLLLIIFMSIIFGILKPLICI